MELSRSPRRAGDLADAVGVAAPTMSKHLRVLLAAGIVADERGARDARVRVGLPFYVAADPEGNQWTFPQTRTTMR